MPDGRPAIPSEIERQILVESGHRCAICGESTPLERAHITPYHKSKQHKAEDLICLCANCHERADKEDWGEKTLREYKKRPWVLRRFDGLQLTPAPVSQLELKLNLTKADFTDPTKQYLISAISARLEVAPVTINVVDTREGSLYVTVELPVDNARTLLDAFRRNDAELRALLYPLELMDMRFRYTRSGDQSNLRVGDRVRIQGRDDLGDGAIIRMSESGGLYDVDIVFENNGIRRLETFPVSRVIREPGIWERLSGGDYDPPLDFFLVQLAHQFPLANTGGELSNARTDLLPHQILLTRDLVAASRRRYLVADEVGLGKTIETGMFIRELVARNEDQRILIVCPAGLIKNWQNELRDAFRLNFDVLGIDFMDSNPMVWETHSRVIASIDTLKKPVRLERLMSSPRWDVVVFDEAHHLSRTRYGKKVQTTQNYKLADALRSHTRDLIFLSATPHQGDPFQFWSLIQLLDDSLFDSPESMLDHRGLLNRVMIRRTKREVTDVAGNPIFMRRQVSTQSFIMGARERGFYEKLTEYLREGYGIAGLGETRTTSQQRAVGFVMTTFQKIMSSSPRAIRQALRRRLLAILAREQMQVEIRAGGRIAVPEIASRIQRLQMEMRELAASILGLAPSSTQFAQADTYISQIKQRLIKKTDEETTTWALDGDEEADDVVYADTNIPDESQKLRDLLRALPDGTDRKFETLIRAIEQIRRENPREKAVIFTQYRETLEFLKDELGKLYTPEKVVTVKGGPLDDKIASVEKFWDENGAQFLISTSAGGEGINLQTGHILFNYDLPWNPMAVEQRIGRIHRYGQKDTVQVYNIIAEDTVEEKIYNLLETKLFDIARSIGKVDPATGHVVEDFRSQVLGYLGSSPNYQDLYRRALVDRDYRRTEREIQDALEKARLASQALSSLAQNLDTFNLENYRSLRGHFRLDDLRLFTEKAITRLGGAMLPDEETYRIETPEILLSFPNISNRYTNATFDRKLAMRRRNTQLMGLGHPLIDALIAYLQGSNLRGEVTALQNDAQTLSLRYLFTMDSGDGHPRTEYKNFVISPDGDWGEDCPRSDVEAIKDIGVSRPATTPYQISKTMQERIKSGVGSIEASLRASHDGEVSIRNRLLGIIVKL